MRTQAYPYHTVYVGDRSYSTKYGDIIPGFRGQWIPSWTLTAADRRRLKAAGWRYRSHLRGVDRTLSRPAPDTPAQCPPPLTPPTEVPMSEFILFLDIHGKEHAIRRSAIDAVRYIPDSLDARHGSWIVGSSSGAVVIPESEAARIRALLTAEVKP